MRFCPAKWHFWCVSLLQGETKWFSKKAFKLPGYFLTHLPGGNLTEYQEPSRFNSLLFMLSVVILSQSVIILTP